MTQPRRVLVTGAAGLIGRAVLDLLDRRGIPAHALDRHTPHPLPAARVVHGSATDPDAVDDALAGTDAVIHLAAIPAPGLAPDGEVFGNNTLATYTVLDRAGRAGVRTAVLAGSYALTGLPFAAADLHPAYVPLDTRHPTQAEDPYALSKLTDETTAAVLARRHRLAATVLRFPFVGHGDRLADRAALIAADPAAGARELWSYLDTRDAARAALLALATPPRPGTSRALHLAAPDTLSPLPTADLMHRHHPGTEIRRPLPGRTTPIDTEPARRLLGFTARHTHPTAPRRAAPHRESA